MVVAQGFRLSGRVLEVTDRDTVPLASGWVVLHQIGLSGAGSVDSGRTDRFGVYHLRAPDRDTAALYISSVLHKGIAYFSSPVNAVGITTDTTSTLFVYDTSSVEPVLQLAQRHVVVRAPEADGSRSVLELMVVANRGTKTRIANDTLQPVWRGALPTGALSFQVGDGEVSGDALFRQGDSVVLVAPVPPGEKQLVFAYVMPRGLDELTIPIDQSIDRFQALIEDTSAVVLAGPVQRQSTEVIAGNRFARFQGYELDAGMTVAFALPVAGPSLVTLWWVVVTAAAVVLAATLVVWWRSSTTVPIGHDDPDVLAAQIAALDTGFEQRGDDDEAAHAAYHQQRAELKARLTVALAKRQVGG